MAYTIILQLKKGPLSHIKNSDYSVILSEVKHLSVCWENNFPEYNVPLQLSRNICTALIQSTKRPQGHVYTKENICSVYKSQVGEPLSDFMRPSHLLFYRNLGCFFQSFITTQVKVAQEVKRNSSLYFLPYDSASQIKILHCKKCPMASVD